MLLIPFTLNAFWERKNLRDSASIIIDVLIYIFLLEKNLDVRVVDFVFFLVFVSLVSDKLRHR